MKIIDTHVHLGNIYEPTSNLEERAPEGKPNIYELLGYRNIYLGKLNYLFKPLVAGSAHSIASLARLPNLLVSMQKNDIDKSVVLALEPYVPSDLILNVCQKNKNLIPFCSVHPFDKEKREKLKRYVQAGAKGLKLHPVIQEVHPEDPAMMEVLEEVKAYNIPVLFHVGWGSVGQGSYGFVKNYKKMLETFPDITFIFAHLGFYEPVSFMELIAQHDNVYCDLSWQPEGFVKKAIDKLGEDRLIYGSDWPFSQQRTSLHIIRKITEKKPVLQEKILYKNAEKLISLPEGSSSALP